MGLRALLGLYTLTFPGRVRVYFLSRAFRQW